MAQPLPPRPSRSSVPEADDWPVDPGRPLILRLLALLGAFSFVMLGLSSLTPLLHPQPNPVPEPLREPPGQATA